MTPNILGLSVDLLNSVCAGKRDDGAPFGRIEGAMCGDGHWVGDTRDFPDSGDQHSRLHRAGHRGRFPRRR